MTRNTERTSPRTVYPAYVALKDSKVRLSDAYPVYPDVGVLLVGIESVTLFDHLLELLRHDDPQLADAIDVVSTATISPAAKVRLRAEMEHTDRLVTHFGCDVYGVRDPHGAWIAGTALRLAKLADELLMEVYVGTHEQEVQLFLHQRDVRLLSEQWTILRKIIDVELGRDVHQHPHPLTPLLGELRTSMTRCLASLYQPNRGSSDAARLNSIFIYLQAESSAVRDLLGEQMPSAIKEFQTYVQTLVADAGTNRHLLDEMDLIRLESAAQEAAAHVAATRERQPAAKDTSTPPKPATPSPAANISAPAPARSQAEAGEAPRPDPESDPLSVWRLISDGLALDNVNRRLRLDGKIFEFEGKTASERFMFMALITKRPGQWVGEAGLTGPGSPWHNGTCTKHAVGSCASKIRKALRAAGMHALATAIKTRTLKESPQARLLWPRPATSVR